MKKKAFGNIVGKGEIAQNEQFHLFQQCLSMQSVSYNPLTATFQLSSVASLKLGQSQNDVLGKGLKSCFLRLSETLDCLAKGLGLKCG